MAKFGDDWMDVPFEKGPRDERIQQVILAGGVVIAAGAIDVGDTTYPILQYRFRDAQDNLLPPITLVLDAPHMLATMKLTRDAVNAACEEALRKRSDS